MAVHSLAPVYFILMALLCGILISDFILPDGRYIDQEIDK